MGSGPNFGARRKSVEKRRQTEEKAEKIADCKRQKAERVA